MKKGGLKLSILDPSDMRKGSTAKEAIEETLALARMAERLHYNRFWVAEHHNSLSAGSTPELLMVRIASETRAIRVGSGGIMLPNHSALKVAENFRMLETLFPARIDLGMGRNPGADKATALLLNPCNDFSEESYMEQLSHLQAFFQDEAMTEDGPVLAVPMSLTLPEQWILSSGGSSSVVAAEFGMGLALAKFIKGNLTPAVLTNYYESFRPSKAFPVPKVLLAIYVTCGETPEDSSRLRKYWDYAWLRAGQRSLTALEEPSEIQDYQFTPEELESVAGFSGQVVSGTPSEVRQQLLDLAESFKVDEIMMMCIAPSAEERVRSFELISNAFAPSDKASINELALQTSMHD